MCNEYWVMGIVIFLFVLSVKKYDCLNKLKDSLEEYIADISPVEVVEDEDVVALEEIRDMIVEYVVRNPEIFSKLDNIKDE